MKVFFPYGTYILQIYLRLLFSTFFSTSALPFCMCVCVCVFEVASVLYTWSVRPCQTVPHLQAGLNIKTEWLNMHILMQPLYGCKKWHITSNQQNLANFKYQLLKQSGFTHLSDPNQSSTLWLPQIGGSMHKHAVGCTQTLAKKNTHRWWRNTQYAFTGLFLNH